MITFLVYYFTLKMKVINLCETIWTFTEVQGVTKQIFYSLRCENFKFNNFIYNFDVIFWIENINNNKIHIFLTSALVVRQLHAPAALPKGKDFVTHYIGGWWAPETAWTLFDRFQFWYAVERSMLGASNFIIAHYVTQSSSMITESLGYRNRNSGRNVACTNTITATGRSPSV
jgi:hypothetical protein